MKKPPYFIIAINDVSEMTFTHVLKPNDPDPFEFALPLHEFNTVGLDEAVKRVGGMVFGIMTHWYPEAFAQFPNLKIPYDAQFDLDQIRYMMSKANMLKTKAFIPAIEALINDLAKQDPKAMEDTTIKVWPDVRRQLEKYPD